MAQDGSNMLKIPTEIDLADLADALAKREEEEEDVVKLIIAIDQKIVSRSFTRTLFEYFGVELTRKDALQID